MEEDEGTLPVAPTKAARGRYLALAVTAARAAAEAAAAALHDARTGGLVEEDLPEGRVRLRAYLPDTPVGRVTVDAVRRRLAAFPRFGLGDPPPLSVEAVAPEAWADLWKEHFRPFPVGRRFWVTPSGEGLGAPEPRLGIRLDPGMAFGSGLHASTQLSIRLLEDVVHPGHRVADVGTGSGILAIAAAHLGAGSVLALDIDPVAVDVARRNVEANGVADRVRVVEHDLLAGVDGVFDVILANLIADLLEAFAPQVAPRLVPGGALIASGIAAGRTGRVRDAFARTGLVVVREEAQEEWSALLARRT